MASRTDRRAVEELADIHEFVALDNPAGADRLQDRILLMIDGLEWMPRRYGLALEARHHRRHDLRQVTVWPYRIVYQVLDKTVRIHMIRHGAQRVAKDLDI